MDVLINIIAWIVTIASGIAISGGFYGLFSAVAYGVIEGISSNTLSRRDKDWWSKFSSYLGMFLAFLLGIRVIFWWLMPMWNCYWNNICLN